MNTKAEKSEFEERILQLKRVAKVVKGGRRFSFTALAVVGDAENHRVGIGLGKAKEIVEAIKKATDTARKSMIQVSTKDTTIGYEAIGRHASSKVLLKPAAPGTGVIAGKTVKALLDCAGIRDIMAKSTGNNTPVNLLKAAFNGLKQIESYDLVAARRGKTVKELFE